MTAPFELSRERRVDWPRVINEARRRHSRRTFAKLIDVPRACLDDYCLRGVDPSFTNWWLIVAAWMRTTKGTLDTLPIVERKCS